MPAPSLKHYSLFATTTSQTTLVTAVGASRALVVSKVIVANISAASVVLTALRVGGQGIVQGLTIPPGGVYTETGLVLVAGETMDCTAGTGSALVFNVFGEEVDN